jgi:hypothetical protein
VRNKYPPIAEALQQCAPPFAQTGLAGVNLLATTHQRDNHGPTLMPVHDVEHISGSEKLRLNFLLDCCAFQAR